MILFCGQEEAGWGEGWGGGGGGRGGYCNRFGKASPVLSGSSSADHRWLLDGGSSSSSSSEFPAMSRNSPFWVRFLPM